MERLTNKKEADAQRKAYERRIEQGYPRNIPEERFLQLAAYEDTGLTPERVETVKAALMGKCLAEIKEINDLPVERMIELAGAEHDGRLVVLPCKVGDVVYQRDSYGNIYEATVQSIVIDAHRMIYITSGIGFDCDAIDKSVFLSREEAEAARKERDM